jgi:hypothetical protein
MAGAAVGAKVGPPVPAGPKLNPHLTLASPFVVVPKSYTSPARQAVTLSADPGFKGSGMFQSSGTAIKFVTLAAGGVEITTAAGNNVFTDAQLTAPGGAKVFAQAVSASKKINDVELTLTLVAPAPAIGPPALLGKPAKATMTAVELTLDICMNRTAPGTTPAPLPQPPAATPAPGTGTDKWYGGRIVQLQDPGNNAGRALMIVRKPKPDGFSGTLSLRAVDITGNIITGAGGKAQIFETETGGAAKPNPHEFGAGTVPATGKGFWVEGRTVSGALRDAGFQLGIKGLEDDGDRIRLTIAQFTQIKATIRSTPPNTPANSVAAGVALPANHVFTSTSISEDFTVNRPLILMRNGQPDIDLEVTVAPAGLPIVWRAIRNPNDHASLGKAADIPTVTPNVADVKKARLNANQKGSFRVRAYIDTNNNNTFEDKEPSIPLNLVLADATVVADNSIAHPGNLSLGFDGGGNFRVGNGSFTGGLAGAGMAMELVADVTGGGADGRLGLDRVFAGLINMVQVRDIIGSYRDTTVAPPTNHRLRFLAASNTAAATAALGGRPLFRPADPAAVLYVLPLLDSGRPGAGQGGESATMSNSNPHTSVNRPVGQRWTIQCIDSPGTTFIRAHPLNGSAILLQVHYHYQFTACFCFWTNVNGNRAPTNDPAERTYSVLRIVNWEIVGDFDIAYPAAPAAPTFIATTAHNILVTGRTTINPIGRAQDNHAEVRPPSGIQIAAWDSH